MQTSKIVFNIKTSVIALLFLSAGCSKDGDSKPVSATYTSEIPLAGNAYLTNIDSGASISDENGLDSWTNGSSVISIFFKTSSAGKLDLALKGFVEGSSTITVKVADKSFDVKLNKPSVSTISVGSITILTPGYVRVDLQGKSKTGATFGTIAALAVGNDAAKGGLIYVSSPDFYYWGRRGPSVHMGYQLPSGNQEFFYNEVTVPEGNDVIGSYFMANGFGEGYSGIQVNSSSERRILFSVWSPFSTDDPNAIPANHKIVLVKKGANVTTGEFGNEGSGGQSYLVFPWKAGQTYKLLTRVRPVGKDSWNQDCTEYSCYFFDAIAKQWMLIAIWKRPSTNTYYTSPYSFLENFNPGMGYLTRKVNFGNQWSRDVSGQWHELTQGRFTCDDTGRHGGRVDFAGGADGKQFFLKSFGFFNECVAPDQSFTRSTNGNVPPITDAELQSILAL